MRLSNQLVGKGSCPLKIECANTDTCTRALRAIREPDAEAAGELLPVHYGGNYDRMSGYAGMWFVEYCEGIGKRQIGAAGLRLLSVTGLSKSQLLRIVTAKRINGNPDKLELKSGIRTNRPFWTNLADALYPQQIGSLSELYNRLSRDLAIIVEPNSVDETAIYKIGYKAQIEDALDPLQAYSQLKTMVANVLLNRAEK